MNLKEDRLPHPARREPTREAIELAIERTELLDVVELVERTEKRCVLEGIVDNCVSLFIYLDGDLAKARADVPEG